ncbi:hypothetical protein EON65_33675 [archaeon]|nr:MAG: hypothetical protein EON65_33675 [archaeon]
MKPSPLNSGDLAPQLLSITTYVLIMDPKGAVAKVHAVRSKTYPVQQCRLSEEVANALGLSKACPETSLRAFRVTATCVSSGPDARHEEFYLFWLGDIISHSDGVEVSQTLLNDYSLKENSTVHISEVPHVSAAIDVRLEPLSKFDWDVASTQASKIENTLLRDVSIVAVDTILTAHVSPSLKAKFKVSHIATNNSSVQSSEVARLTNSTSLIISPYIDTHVDSSQYEETGRQFDSLDLPTLLAKLSANLHLRVMPACHNSQITGYMANRSSHSDRRAATTNDILDSLTSTPIVPSTPAKSPSNSYVWTNKGIDEHDINTVYIHPIVLKTCLEVMVARTVSADELQDIMIKHMYTTWICALTPVIPTNMVSIARKVVFTDYVRPYYVVIPSCIRKSLGSIGDYDKIQTAICIRSQCVLPTAIRLCPLYNRDKMGDMVEDPETTRSTNAGVVDGLVRFIDTHSSVHSPCMLSHNQIISLNASQDGGKITVQDYAVQLDVQHTSTSDRLALCTCIYMLQMHLLLLLYSHILYIWEIDSVLCLFIVYVMSCSACWINLTCSTSCYWSSQWITIIPNTP